MAGSKTDALEARFLDHMFKGGASPALTALSTVYVALFTAVPSDSGGGTEVTGSAYARVASASSVWNRTGSSITNSSDIAFPTVTTTLYTVLGWAIFDAGSGGNMLFWGDLTSTTMNVGDTPRFASSSLTITED